MPCFSSGPPNTGTSEYEAWLTDTRRMLDSFTHVVDYYYRKAGMEMPEPASPDDAHGPPDGGGAQATPGLDPDENARVLQQVLLHLDCDDVNVFHLNEIRHLLRQDRAARWRGYLHVLNHCFRALRNGFRDRPTTGTMWVECGNPALMLDHLRGKVSGRKLRLFAVACCRRVQHLLVDERSQDAVEVAERFAEGTAAVGDLEAAAKRMRKVGKLRGYYGPVAAWAVVPSAEDAARYAAWNAFVDRDDEISVQADLLRCIFPNPFRTVPADSRWLTSTVLCLARGIYEDRAFDRMPILGDALEDAGCADVDVLAHCRRAGPHALGCWVVDLVLGLN